MKLLEIKSLREISKLYNIPVDTLKTRLKSKNVGLIENVDFKRMGQGQGIIFTPLGIQKIIKKKG